jgi:UDP-2-acetamido-3-amino-2,3-dideoxy-glucuronate N-acetyltransferase
MKKRSSTMARVGRDNQGARLASESAAVHSGRAQVSAGQAVVDLASGARLHRIPRIDEPLGSLVFAEVVQHLPFEPKRFFAVFDVPEGVVRGGHAHRTLHEFLVCLRGAWVVMLDNGSVQEAVLLDAPDVGLYLPPRLWRRHYQHGPGALLVALASDVYRPDDHVRDYETFARMTRV